MGTVARVTPKQAAHLRALAEGLRDLTRAARRAHERGDAAERDELLDACDAQLARMIDAIPPAPRPVPR